MRKVIFIISENGIETEFWQETFMEVYEANKGENVIIGLKVFHVHKSGIGWEEKRSAIIGNCQDELTMEDYYNNAYDKII